MANITCYRDGTNDCRIICTFKKDHMSEELQNRIVARIVRCCGEKILKPRWRPNEYVLIVEIKKNHLHSGAQMEVEQHLAGAY